MGRMLERMREAEARQVRAVAEPPTLPARTQSAPADALPTLAVEEEVPFIEVGPAGTPTEASASVTAHGPVPPSRPMARMPAYQAPHFQPNALVPGLRAATPLAVEFRSRMSGQDWQASAARRFAPELVAFHDPQSAVGQQYRSLWSGLKATLPDEPPQALLCTAAAEGIGQTTALLNLAIAAACESGLPVLVVDANLTRPAAARRFGLPAAPGVCELLAAEASLEQALRQTGQRNLTVLTAGWASKAKAGQLNLAGLLPVLRQLREHFALVFVDGPIWDDGLDVVGLASASDAVYVFLAQGHDEQQANELAEQITSHGYLLPGIILTTTAADAEST